MFIRYCFVAVFVTLSGIAGQSSNLQAAFVVPSFRDDPPPVSQSSYQEWLTFSPPGAISAAFTPDVTTFNSSGTNNPFGTPELNALNPSSVVTSSSGNIYTPGGAASFSLTLPSESGTFDYTKVVVQISGRGTLLDVNSLELNSNSGTFTPDETAVEISNVVDPNPFGGIQQETWFQFLVPSHDDSYTLSFASEESSFSLHSISVDMEWGAGLGTLESLPAGNLILLESSASLGGVPEPASGLLVLSFACMYFVKPQRKNGQSRH